MVANLFAHLVHNDEIYNVINYKSNQYSTKNGRKQNHGQLIHE